MLNHFALWILLSLATGNAAASKPTSCERPGQGIRVFGHTLTITQLEQELAARSLNEPELGFSRAEKSWIAFKEAAQPGDIVRSYDGPRWNDGTPISGGYVLLRGRCVVARFTLWLT